MREKVLAAASPLRCPPCVFSACQELQRELSFQGGSGFYFHFFKRMSAAPSFDRGTSRLAAEDEVLRPDPTAGADPSRLMFCSRGFRAAAGQPDGLGRDAERRGAFVSVPGAHRQLHLQSDGLPGELRFWFCSWNMFCLTRF